MSEIILYPTETVYALGVNPLDQSAWEALCALKQRSSEQPASWLVRDVVDIEKYAEVDEVARNIIEAFLPGPLTLILPAKASVPAFAQTASGTVSFRISADPVAQKLIAEHMREHNAPLTCTSANVHGLPTMPDTQSILEQFAGASQQVTRVIADGARVATPSTVLEVVNGEVQIIRPGSLTQAEIEAALR